MQEPWRESAHRLAQLIRSGEVTATEVMEAHLERIGNVNAKLNAVVRVLAAAARAAAQAADAAVRGGAALGPLHGVPFTAKENIDVAGLPTTWGVAALAQALPARDAPVVERMRAAGAILVGRTNLPDMGLRIVTESSLYGVTANPWAGDRTAGGSSGGEAAALASGMTPLGLGNDLGGSLRNPAAACGIASIRPSAGRVPHASTVPVEEQMLFSQLMMVPGPMARTVADVRLALQVVAGAHPRDPWAVTAPLDGLPVPRPVRVAVLAEPPGGDTAPAVRVIVGRAAQALAAAGYDVVEACPPAFEQSVRLWGRLLCADMATAWPAIAALSAEPVRRMGEAFFAHWGVTDSAAMLSRMFVERDGIARAWSLFLEDHPLLLTPAWTALPPAHGFDLETPSAVTGIARAMLPANLLGLPSACVPAGLDPASGLPVGVLLTGRRFREDLCLDAAQVVEAASGVVTPIDPRD